MKSADETNHSGVENSGPIQGMLWTWAGWEPEAFYRRLGGFHEAQEGAAEWLGEWREQLDSAETAESLAKAGVTHVTTRFYKGFGLAAERADISRIARMIRNYHKHGVRVFTYIQYGSIMPEAITVESPDASEWKRLDWKGEHDGHPYEYGDQYWRDKPCPNQPGFLESLYEVIEEAIRAGSDGIWLDNLQSDGCHCALCQKAFREYLKERIEDTREELGLPSLDRIEVPRGNRFRDPLVQWWHRFRRSETEYCLRKLVATARSLRPGIPFIVNIGLGSPQRYEADNGNWPPFLKTAGMTYAENNLFPRWNEEKAHLVTQHFPFKLAEASGFCAIPGSIPKKISGSRPIPQIPTEKGWLRMLAESLLFGGHAFGGPIGLRAENGGLSPLLLRDAALREFWRSSVDATKPLRTLLERSRDANAAAVLYSYEANAFDAEDHRVAREAFEQMMHQHQLPFRYLLSTDEQWPRSVKILILPHVLPIDDGLAARLRNFIKAGGKVVATGRTGFYDSRFRARKNPVLEGLFQCGRSAWQTEESAQWLIDPASGSLWIPGEWGINEAATQKQTVSQTRLAGIMTSMIREAHGFQILCSSPHVMATTRQLENGNLALGLINYSEEPVSDLRIDFSGSFPSFQAHNLPQSTMDPLETAISRNGKSLLLSKLDVFAVLEISVPHLSGKNGDRSASVGHLCETR